MLTESSTQGVDLALRFLVQPGDAVVVDDPSYFRLLPLLKAHRVNVVAVTAHARGAGRRRRSPTSFRPMRRVSI